METEKLYLICVDCGEAFDTLETAKAHEDSSECSNTYDLSYESEAF